jgi:hypothetical protein
MAALVVLVEGSVARRPMRLLDVDDWAYRLGARVASHDAPRYDVLCFGDSLAKLSLVPRALTERSGLRAYNLAVSGSQAPASACLLRKALDSGARPAAVVVDFFPPLLRLGPRHNLGRWANLVDTSGAARLAWSASDAGLFGVAMLGRVLPSIHCRPSIRAQIVAALAGDADPRLWSNVLLRRNWSKNAGAHLTVASPTVAGLTDRQVADLRSDYYPRWEVHPANLAGVERFLELAASRGVPVYWVLPPVLPALQAKLSRSGFDTDHEAFLRSFQARYPGLTVLDGRGAVTAPSAFFDANHLAAPGAYAFSLAVGDALRRSRTGRSPSRWIALGRVRPQPLPEGLEDVEQSALALQKLAPVRR